MSGRRRWLSVLTLGSILAAVFWAMAGATAVATASTLQLQAVGGLDCNGDSPIQVAVRHSALCADVRGFNNEWNANTWDGRFYDNGVYIGHDEPDLTFLSNRPGSGDNVTWNETLPGDPYAMPTVRKPGHDVIHTFELTPAPWFSMALCDNESYPTTQNCTPESDSNAPTCVGTNFTGCNPGNGSAFMEFQFYPPGMAPFADSVSCDNTHWCAAMVIWALECTPGFVTCNTNCEEPGNVGFIQRNGVPTGPPSPQESDLATVTPDGQTLMMNPGDRITVHMYDAPAPGGGHAFEIRVTDLTTGQSGWMQASAANGFAETSAADCSGTPYNFEPEYSTAAAANIVPWGADATDIGEAIETGHFEPCTSVTGAGSYPLSATISDTYYNVCNGPYEANGADESGEPSDAFCYPAGDTHGALNTAPDLVTGCEDDLQQNGDLDFDGTPYYLSDWPVGPSATNRVPGSLVQALPTTNGGQQYSQYFAQTDIALSEATCSGTTTVGCSVPPVGPGGGYPYYSRVNHGGQCTIEFGNVGSGPGVDDLGQDAQYGSDQIATLGYPQYIGAVHSNACRGQNQQ